MLGSFVIFHSNINQYFYGIVLISVHAHELNKIVNLLLAINIMT